MSQIINIIGREILDSRGNPTIQVECFTDLGGYGMANVPSGASTGKREALELRDNDPDRFQGKGVLRAVENINEHLAEVIIGYEVTDQVGVDQCLIEMDSTENKSKYGANALLGISLAVAKAAADELELPLYKYLGGVNAKILPVPMCNVINGGEHADNTIDFQEFMIMPVGASNMREAIRWAAEIFHTLKKLLHDEGYATTVGDEGGFAPNLKTAEEALDLLVTAIKKAGYTADENGVMIAMDPAASELYNPETKQYHYKGMTKATKAATEITKTSAEQVDYLLHLFDKYPIISIEDGLAEQDWAGFEMLTAKIGHRRQIVGDDIFVTNPVITKKGIQKKAANAVLIKVNQIGTLTETIDTVQLAQKAGWACVISHRSGETEDSFIADLAVALNCGQIKTGSLSRSDRIAKYNRLLQIEEELSFDSAYLGLDAFYNIQFETK